MSDPVDTKIDFIKEIDTDMGYMQCLRDLWCEQGAYPNETRWSKNDKETIRKVAIILKAAWVVKKRNDL